MVRNVHSHFKATETGAATATGPTCGLINPCPTNGTHVGAIYMLLRQEEQDTRKMHQFVPWKKDNGVTLKHRRHNSHSKKATITRPSTECVNGLVGRFARQFLRKLFWQFSSCQAAQQL